MLMPTIPPFRSLRGLATGALLTLASCATQMPAPQDHALSGSRSPGSARASENLTNAYIEPAPQSTMVKVHFGTNRKVDEQAAQRQAPPFFSSEDAGRLSYGTLQVSVDANHPVGDIKHSVHLREMPELESEQEFIRQLRDDLAKQSGRNLLVFIHGYNVSFEKAAKRSAQLKYDLQFNGETAFFSWPSQGSLLGYWSDETAIRNAEPFLEKYLILLARESKARNIYIIAHSMGNRAFGNVFPKVHQALKGDQCIREIMLAAPDIDAEVFRKDIAPRLQYPHCGTTVYSSSRDKALWGSWLVHGFSHRAGQKVLGLPGVESVDASSVDTNKLGLGHSYYGEQARLLADLRGLISGRRPPQRVETLEALHVENSTWLLRN